MVRLKEEEEGAQDRRAIINPNRQILPGPQYLDHLVNLTLPRHVALEYVDRSGRETSLSYEEIDLLSRRLAADLLQTKAPGHARIVPIAIPQHPALYTSYQAVLKCGDAFCPIDPETPRERLAFIVQDVGATSLLCLPDTLEYFQTCLPNVRCHAVDLEKLRSKSCQTERSVRPLRKPSDVAYVMYTSGSTGKPKGVPVSHFAVCQSLLAHNPHIPHFTRFLQFAAPTFDVSLFEVFFTWFRGSTLICCDRERLLSDLPGIINNCHVDAVELTPTVAATLIRSRSVVPNLQVLLTIGEMLTPQVIREFGGAPEQPSLLYAMYGPTEAAIHCSVVPQMRTDSSVHNVGYPLSTVTAFILSDDPSIDPPKILSLGDAGELAVSGQLANGYLNRSEQTAAAFVELPGHGLVYRTGDRAKTASDGSLQILGRLSGGQVKLRGQRIELGEIEHAASRVNGVDLAVALVIEDTIVVFCSGKASMTVLEIRQECKSWLPRHMRPGNIIILAEGIPRLSSGKVDRRALEAYFRQRPQEAQRDTALTGKENLVLKTFRSVLGKDLGLTSDLRDHGLNSLRSIQIASELKSAFPLINVTRILEADTVSQLLLGLPDQYNAPAECMSEPFAEETRLRNAVKQVNGVQSPVGNEINTASLCGFCSDIQIGMLLETKKDQSLNYNYIKLKIDRSVSFDRFMMAFESVCTQNTILRASFIETDDYEAPFLQQIRQTVPSLGNSNLESPLALTYDALSHSVDVYIHHALYDGWSWDLVMYDINAHLRSKLVIERPSYDEYKAAKLQLQRQCGESDLMAWVEYLKDAKCTKFPMLRSELKYIRETACSSRVMLSHFIEKIDNAAQTLKVSKAALFHTAVNVILAEFYGSSEVMTGLVTAGRDAIMPKVADVIGPCIATLPLLANVGQKRILQDVLQDTYQGHMHSLRYPNVSLAQIKSSMRIPMDATLFDVLFVWQESPHSAPGHDDLVTLSRSQDKLPYTIVVEVTPYSDHYDIKMTYDVRYMCSQQASNFLEMLEFATDVILCKPGITIENMWDGLPGKLYSIANTTNLTQPSSSILEKVHDVVKQDPDRVALEFVNVTDLNKQESVSRTLTYATLYRRAKIVAHRLLSHHAFRQDDIVMIFAEKSVDLYILLCATMFSGIAYLCVDVRTPVARLQAIIDEARPKLVVCDESRSVPLQENIPCERLESLTIDGGFCPNPPLPLYELDALAYAVFTSGSTGVPKGVLVTRANLLANIEHLSSVYPYENTSRLLQACSPAFDVSVFEIFWTWYCGMTLCAATNDVLFADIEGFINKFKITHLSLTPSVAALVQPEMVPTVQFLVCAGEPMSAKVFEAWNKKGLHQGYGPSETTNICNVRSYAKSLAQINNVGPPFSNTSIFICRQRASDRVQKPLDVCDFRPVPIGVVGEVWIGGSQVGRGYTDSRLTTRSWLQHPHFGRVYRSGDMGRLLADSSLVIEGREDSQTKIRGHRVELQEISSQLLQSGMVVDVHTIVLRRANDIDLLISFYVPSPESQSAQARSKLLFDCLSDSLPTYMIPDYILPMDRLPLTNQGKIDQRLLQSQFWSTCDEDLIQFSRAQVENVESVIPNEDESRILEIVRTLNKNLAVEMLPHMPFQSYGIDSIRAAVLAKRLNQAGFESIQVSDILKFSSARSLARAMSERRLNNTSSIPSDAALTRIPETLRTLVSANCGVTSSNLEKILPCTPLQISILASALARESYVNHLTFHINGDICRLRRAWEAVVERNESLRTLFHLTEDPEHPFIQVILCHHPISWTEVIKPQPDISLSPFKEPPLRFQICRNGEVDTQLHVFIHHAVYDGDAMTAIQSEVESLYHEKVLAPPVPFSRYLDFMVSINTDQGRIFWQQMLHNVRPSRLRDRLNLAAASSDGSSTTTLISSIDMAELGAFTKTFSTTTLAICQTALTRLLSYYLDSADVCFGSIFSARNIPLEGAERIVGPCFNALPCRGVLSTSLSNQEVSRKYREFNVDVLPFQAESLRSLTQKYSPDGRPLFDILLLLQTPRQKLDEVLWELDADEGQMDFPFILEVIPDEETGLLSLTLHSTINESEEFHDALLENFDGLLRDCIEHPGGSSMRQVSFKLDLPNLSLESMRDDGALNGQSQLFNIPSGPLSRLAFDTILEFASRKIADLTEETTIFHLGLDSISTVQVASKLRTRGFNMSTGDLLEDPRISAIIELCSSRGQQPKPSHSSQAYDFSAFDARHRYQIAEKAGVASTTIEAVLPCTSTQNGILAEFLRSDGKVYFNSIELRLDPDLDINTLEDAWDRLVLRHQILRTGFMEIEDDLSPFAMIVYQGESEGNSRVNGRNGQHHVYGSDSLDLNSPPWYVQYLSADGHRYVRLRMLHALYDAFSLQQMLDELAFLYRGEELSKPPPVVEALGSIVVLNREDLSHSKHWRSFSGTVEATKFPDLNITRNIASRFQSIPHVLCYNHATIKGRCSELGLTMSTTCQMAWAQLLASYTSQNCVSFGHVLAGRNFNEKEFNQVVFPCLNTLPVIANITSDDSTLAANIQKHNAILHTNPHMTLSSIKKMIGIEGDLFDTLLVLQHNSNSKMTAPWTIVADNATAEYAVSLEVIPEEDDIRLCLTFNLKIIPVEHAEIILEQFESLLGKILGLQPASSHRVLASMPAEIPHFPSEHRALHDLVLATALQFPDRIAMEYVSSLDEDSTDRQLWTYAEVVSAAAQVAQTIQSQGVRTGELVAHCFEKSPEGSVSLLAILMAGCTYVAIDPSAPAARQRFIIEDASCRLVLTGCGTSLSDIDLEGVSQVQIDLQELIKSPPAGLESMPIVVGSQICYCLYTSGTTGTPKGCLISHESVIQAMHSFSQIFAGHWSSKSRWLQFAAYHFDVSVLEHFWSWKEGLCVTIAPRDLLFEDLPGNIQKLGITHLDLTPSLARLLTPESVPSLTEGVFIVGGEQVRQDIIDTWGGTGCLYNFYGPSEVTIGCTVHPRVQKNVKPTNIGQQWTNVGTYVLDPESEHSVLIGGVGELCLSGALVGKGYLNRPEMTAQRFVTLKANGERIYRSGDLVRMLHNGSFEYLGRIDGQVKLRGQRLEIGEIDHVLLEEKSFFQDVATIVGKHPELDKEQLTAFLALSSSTKSNDAGLTLSPHDPKILTKVHHIRKMARQKLPGYMIPTYFLVLDSLPLTVNNKVDTKSLGAFFAQTPLNDIRQRQEQLVNNASSNDLPDQTKKILEIIADFLGVHGAEMTLDRSLFQLGIDSISAISLARKLRKGGFTNASVATLLRYPNLSDLGEMLVGADQHSDIPQTAQQAADERIQSFSKNNQQAILHSLREKVENVEYIAPCTPLQEGMISRVLAKGDQNGTYLNKFVFKLNEGVDLDRLSRSWHELADRLAILRTFFVETDDGPAQVVLRQVKYPVFMNKGSLDNTETTDITSSNFESWTKEASKFAQNAPWRVDLWQGSGGGSDTMSLFMFHGLYDGISIELLLGKLADIYDERIHDTTINIQFHEALKHGPLLDVPGAAEFWRSALNNTQLLFPTNAPLDKDSKTLAVHSSASISPLKEVSTALGMTVQSILLSAWLTMLAQTFERNPTIGLVISGRSINLDGADTIIGPMFNTIPFRSNSLSGNANLEDLTKECHNKLLDILPFQHASLSQIRKSIHQSSEGDLFDSLFVYQGRHPLGSANSFELWSEVNSESIADYPLNIEVDETDKEFKITIVGADFVPINQLMQSFTRLLDDLATQLSIKLSPHFLHYPEGDASTSHEAQYPLRDSADSSIVLSEDQDIIRNEIAKLANVATDSISATNPTIFELGLDSVDALKLSSRLKSKNFLIPVSKILKNPTVAGLAECSVKVENASTAPSEGASEIQANFWTRAAKQAGIDVESYESVMPTTPMQQSLLIDYENYFHVHSFEVKGDVGVDQAVKALDQVISNTVVLRTRFHVLDHPVNSTSFLQLVSPSQPVDTDTPDLIRIQGQAELQQYLTDLKRGARLDTSEPTCKVVMAAENRLFLVLALSHALYDGWSLQLILNAFSKALSGDPIPRTQQVEIGAYVSNASTAAHSSDAKQFWASQLLNAKPTIVQLKSPTTPPQLVQRPCSLGLSTVQERCRTLGITLQSLSLAAWTLTLIYLEGKLDIAFGLMMSGRTSETEEQLGFPTFNTVIFRPSISLDWTKDHLLQQIHQLAIGMFEFQDFPLSQALKLVDHDGSGLFNTLFTFQKTPKVDRSTSVQLEPAEFEDVERSPPYALNFELEEQSSALMLTLATQTGVMDEADTCNVVDIFEIILCVLAAVDSDAAFVQSDRKISVCGLPTREIAVRSISTNPPALTSGEDEVQSTGWSETEQILREAFATAANVDQQEVEHDMSLFHLGLDSVSTIKVTKLLREAGLRVPVSTILREQTIRRIAMAVDGAYRTQQQQTKVSATSSRDRGTGQVESLVTNLGIKREEIQEIVPATAGQEYMLDMWRSSSGRLFYATFWLEVVQCSQQNFSAAFDRLINTIPALRTKFVHYDGRMFQIVFNQESGQHGPVSYHARSEGDKLHVALHIHHALYDAVSLDLVLQHLSKLCSSPVTTTSFSIDYRSFCERISIDPAAQEAYWREYLGDRRQLGSLGGTFEAKRTEMFTPKAISAKELTALAKREGVSVQALFFAVIGRMYSQLTMTMADEVVIGIYLANRTLDLEGIETLAAPKFNIVPLKVGVEKTTSVITAARQIQKDLEVIGRAENCGVRMKDIYDWARVRVDCYVNFLRLPNDARNGDGDRGGLDEVRIKHADGLTKERMRLEMEVVKVTERSPFLDGSDDHHAEWCLPALDIETRIDEEGFLDIGMFAPEDMMNEHEMTKVMDDVKFALLELGEGQ